jgi:hypothetical protein
MNTIDRQILESCRAAFGPLKALTGSIPSGSLYRHVRRLIRLGWLEKEGNLYQTTDAGHHQLVEQASGQSWDALAGIYAPLALVPTPVHRALIELILAATAARQHEIRPDRHPFFVAYGATLRWKTSLGRFVCHALGLDPAVQVVDCGSEAGRSLTFRRGSDGTLVSKRALLETPFVVLDEFQAADRSVLSALGIFLSGRLVTPVENEQLTVRPVPLLTLNPTEAPTLEARLGLSAPLIRRALLANLDAVPMPDLAAVGEQAVAAARAHPPLVLAAPRADTQDSQDAILALVRGVLLPEAHERVDVEVIATLCAGMTALIPEPVPAIAQVVHGVGMLAETLGWTRPGWIEMVTDFMRGPTKPASGVSALVRGVPPATQAGHGAREPASPASIALAVPPPPPRRRTVVPELDLSAELRARLIWFAMETQQDVEVALTTLLDFYLACREAGSTMGTLAAALTLAQQLELVGVDVDTLDGYLTTLEQLRDAGCEFTDVPEARRVLALLDTLPVAWTWEQAETAMRAVATILETGTDLEGVGEFLARHRHLEAVGFDAATAGAVAEALTRSGATGERRDAVLETLVEIAGQQIDRASLEEERQRLDASVNALIADAQRWKTKIQDFRDQEARLKGGVARLNETRVRFQAESDTAAGDLAVAAALRAFLMGRPADTEPLWTSLEALLDWRRRGGRLDDALGQMLTQRIKEQIVEFFQKLLQDLPKP